MPPDLQLPGTVHTIWCLDDSLGSQLTSSSPHIGSNEASISYMDEDVAMVCDGLRTALWEAQAQSMAEACRQKWTYDRKIGTVNLKPGDLILVKVDAFKGRRKIRDRWEEETWEVVHQITTGIPSYKVMNQHRKSQVLHWNWLLLSCERLAFPCVWATVIHRTGVPAPPHERLPL